MFMASKMSHRLAGGVTYLRLVFDDRVGQKMGEHRDSKVLWAVSSICTSMITVCIYGFILLSLRCCHRLFWLSAHGVSLSTW